MSSSPAGSAQHVFLVGRLADALYRIGGATKVAALVAESLSNPEIATRLLLSRRTVATHVSHILRKLGVNSRIDIAREAALRTATPN